MYVKQFFVEGLGHASYLIASDQTREAAVVDPRRDVDVYVEEARREGLVLRYALETHNHNDFVSGAKALADRYGVTQVASAEAGLQFPYRAVREGDTLALGELRIAVLQTPGHTPEHVTYVVSDLSRADAPVLAFTGGDLLVGAVGRPDLLGRELGEKLAPLLHDSLHGKILKLEDYVEVLPTHGSGSLCGRGMSSKRTSTIGYERRFNPALQKASKEEFVDFVLSGNPGIPTYYKRMRPTNQEGPEDWTLAEPKPITAREIAHLVGHGAIVLDTRSNTAFGGGHIPSALNVGLDASFATWVGWLLPADTPLVLVLESQDQWAEAVTALARIGYERVAGYLLGGMGAWIGEGLPVEHVPQIGVHELHDRLARQRLGGDDLVVLDVRADAEWESGHIVGAIQVSLDQLPERLDDLDVYRDQPIAVVCGSGYRSSIAVSLLKRLRLGFARPLNVLGGMSAWSAAKYPTTRQGSGRPTRRAAGSASRVEEKAA